MTRMAAMSTERGRVWTLVFRPSTPAEDEMNLDFSWAAQRERLAGSEKPRAEGARGTACDRKTMGNS